MIRTRMWREVRRWVSATTAVAALMAPASADIASAATFDKKGSFAKTDASKKKTSAKTSPEIDPKKELRNPRKDLLLEARITRLMTTGESVGTVAAADLAATDAQLAFRRAVREVIARSSRFKNASVTKLARKNRRHRAELERTAKAFANAELELRDMVDSLWNGFDGKLDNPTVIDAPLAAAMLQLQIEVRGMLGAELHTEVPNLAEMPGCAGDLIAERMIAKYGEAVLDTGAERGAEAEILGRIAKQLACISTDQSRKLDHVLYAAYYRVFRKLEKAGLRELQPAYARIVAPLMLLVLDTVKHRGHSAGAYYWFEDHREILQDIVERLGWATGDVYWLYDRYDGRLLGFPPCRGSEARCILPDVLFDSLADPAALGDGDCAISGMVARGASKMGSRGDRYACPSSACEDQSGKSPAERRLDGTSIGGFDFGGFDLGSLFPFGDDPEAPAWLGLTEVDRADMASQCGTGVGGSSGDRGGPQGARGGYGDTWNDTEECTNDFLAEPKGPFEAYTHCVMEGLEEGAPNPLDLGSFEGAPMDPKCGILDGGKKPKPSPTPAPSASPSASATPKPTAKPSPSPGLADKAVDAIKKMLDALTNAPSATAPIVSTELELLKPSNAKNVGDAARAVVDRRIDEAEAAGFINKGGARALKKMSIADATEYMKDNGLWSCVSPEDCSSSCTAVNAQLEAKRACDMQLLDSARPPETRKGGPNDPDTVINWGPDGKPGEGGIGGVLGCMLATTAAPHTNPECGIVQCANGLATAWSGRSCCGDLGDFGREIRLDDSCLQMQCAEGNPSSGAGGTCTCGDEGPGGAPNPPPSPESPGGHGIGDPSGPRP